jgi:hypothetical protein
MMVQLRRLYSNEWDEKVMISPVYIKTRKEMNLVYLKIPLLCLCRLRKDTEISR